jgi:hypothetical protein
MRSLLCQFLRDLPLMKGTLLIEHSAYSPVSAFHLCSLKNLYKSANGGFSFNVALVGMKSVSPFEVLQTQCKYFNKLNAKLILPFNSTYLLFHIINKLLYTRPPFIEK